VQKVKIVSIQFNSIQILNLRNARTDVRICAQYPSGKGRRHLKTYFLIALYNSGIKLTWTKKLNCSIRTSSLKEMKVAVHLVTTAI
jgi:hypothetical protein